MHCKFLVFLLIVFLFFSFFLSTREFRFIETIGAHGKQNPDFIILLLLLSLSEALSLTVFISIMRN